MKLSDKNIVRFSAVIAFLFLVWYFICFRDAPLSKDTIDWGAFGSYAAISINIITVALIFITYREQGNTNKITRSEQHIATMSKTLMLLSGKNEDRLERLCACFCAHFKVHCYNLTCFDCIKIIKVCSQYYMLLLTDKDYNVSLGYTFRYACLCIDYILNDQSLSKEDKELRLTELSYIMPESMRILLFGWVLVNNPIKLGIYYKFGLFVSEEKTLPLLEDVISYVCTGTCPPERKHNVINPDEILFEEKPNESFFATYEQM